MSFENSFGFNNDQLLNKPILPGESREIKIGEPLKIESEKPLFDKEEVLAVSRFQIDMLVEEMSIDNRKQVNEFLKNYPQYSGNLDYYLVIGNCLKNKLNYQQISLILTSDWESLSKMPNNEKIFDFVKELKLAGLLDHAGIFYNNNPGKNLNLDLNMFQGNQEGINFNQQGFNIFNQGGSILEQQGFNQMDNFSESNELGLSKLIDIAKGELGTVEGPNADKYGGFNTKKIPWCAAFVNWCLKQAGYEGTGSNLALSFVGLSGYGHVGIKEGNNLISGNSKNSVRVTGPLSRTPVLYAIPTPNGIIKYPGKIDFKDIPNGAIVCWRRNVNNKNLS